jgi:TPR repeat protein
MAGESRDPVRAVNLLEKSCARSHGPSCFNLAVIYKNGDIGVERSEEKHNHYRAITESLVKQAGALLGTKTA